MVRLSTCASRLYCWQPLFEKWYVYVRHLTKQCYGPKLLISVNNWLLHCVARRKHRLEITSSVCTTKLKVFTETTFRLLLSGWCFHGKECLSEQDGVINHEEAGSNSSQCLINWCRQREPYTCFMLRRYTQLMTCFSLQSRRNTVTHML